MAAIKKYNGSTWETTTARKYETKSEIITPPTTIYADGTAATVSLKGNTIQNGTPSPTSPVDVVGVGERTENLFDSSKLLVGYHYNQSGNLTPSQNRMALDDMIDVSNINNVVITYDFASTLPYVRVIAVLYSNGALIERISPLESGATIDTSQADKITFAFYSRDTSAVTPENVYNIMLSLTAKPYEPYGYKIPILINSTTYTLYIGNNPLRKSLDGTAYDTLDSDGTLIQRVDSDGSVLATPIVTQITMPTFATIDGANSVSVDTTVQPSEMTMTYTGWHDSSVKEWDGSQWE